MFEASSHFAKITAGAKPNRHDRHVPRELNADGTALQFAFEAATHRLRAVLPDTASEKS